MSLLQSFRTEPSLRRPAVVAAALLTLVIIGERVLTTVFTGVTEGSATLPMWLPQAGTTGETVVFYTLLLNVLQFVAIPATLMWLAYAYGHYTAGSAD